jgi:type I RM system S subunit
MKTTWQIKKLGKICDVITKGTTPTTNGFQFQNDGINFIKIESISNDGDFIESKFAYVSKKCHNEFKRSQLKEGDILYSIAGALGRVAIVNKEVLPANTNQALAIIRLKKDINIDRRFLTFALKTETTFKQIEKNKAGVAQLNLSLSQLSNFEIPIPSIGEQRRIVEVLDKALGNVDDSIKKTQQNIANLKELWNSALNQAFTHNSQHWQEKKLSEVCVTILAGGDKPSVFSKIKTNKCNIPIYANAVALNGLYGFTDKALVVQDSVTVAARGSKVGFVCIRNEKYLPIVRLIVAIPDKEILENEYLGYALKYIIPQGNGTAIPQITIPNFKRNKILLPPLSEQKQIVEKLDALSAEIKAIESNYFKKLENLSELKQAILNKAFKGEL